MYGYSDTALDEMKARLAVIEKDAERADEEAAHHEQIAAGERERAKRARAVADEYRHVIIRLDRQAIVTPTRAKVL